MGTAIEWADDVWNPTVGCSKVSEGCGIGGGGCYAIGVAHRGMQAAHRGLTVRTERGIDWTGEVRALSERLDVPLKVRKPTRWFVDSMSDLFHDEVPDEFIARAFGVMAVAHWHTFLVLTKRPQRMARWAKHSPPIVSVEIAHRLGITTDKYGPFETSADARRLGQAIGDARVAAGLDRYSSWPLPNVWAGTSIELDKYAWRANHLRATPAAVRWLSLEPLLGPLPSLDLTGIDWVVIGGESGPGARPMDPTWVRDIRDRCVDAGIPFLMKQWGEWVPYEADPQPPFWDSQHGDLIDGHHLPADLSEGEPTGGWWAPEMLCDPVIYRRVGKKAAGRTLDGRTWDEYPEAVARA